MANRSSDKEFQRNGPCLVCKKSSFNTCSRCGEFYCSKQCQRVDWHKHKYYCFDMPELIMKSPDSSDQQFNDIRFQSDNRRILQNLRGGEHRFEWVESIERSRTALESNEKIGWTPQKRVVFNFGDYPRNNDDVIITHVRHANSFYIRTCSSDIEFEKNAKDFDDYGGKGMKLTSLPQKNDLVLVRFDARFQRAIVLQDVEKTDDIVVGLIDTGRKVSKSLKNMRQLSDELKRRKRYNFVVTLDHLPPGVMSMPFNELRKLVNNRTVFKIKFYGHDWQTASNFRLLEKESGLPIEKLVKCESNGNDSKVNNSGKLLVNTLPMGRLPLRGKPPSHTTVKRTASTTIHSPNAAEKLIKSLRPISFADLCTETLPKVAKLIILDNSSANLGYVSAIATKNILKLDDIHNKVGECGDVMHDIYKPKLEELCLVKFEGEWYRAINYGSKFLLIDWGYVEDIDARNIRRFPEKLKIPCYTFVCRVQNAAQRLAQDTTQIERLKKLLDIQSEHPDCFCVHVEGELMEYNVTFPKLSNFCD
ncbi:protein vreteno-like [Bradysia coprophila]|uniref:protein vreteno-like n=1 Tax=Bradysia coprophila TaxID=38358 RepID=UPI00187D7939|nr:protein vreteno-like [Bradysia coprophila]